MSKQVDDNREWDGRPEAPDQSRWHLILDRGESWTWFWRADLDGWCRRESMGFVDVRAEDAAWMWKYQRPCSQIEQIAAAKEAEQRLAAAISAAQKGLK